MGVRASAEMGQAFLSSVGGGPLTQLTEAGGGVEEAWGGGGFCFGADSVCFSWGLSAD